VATVSITIPDAIIPRITAAGRATFPQYSALADAALFRRVVADYWRTILSTYEAGAAGRAITGSYDEACEAARVKALADAAGIA
jgi:hypothetical protein